MNINIKEIFKSDLDPNNSNWWSKDKIDKLNFNFFQFINGGMPGPSGNKGADGDYGSIGPIGFQGFIGPQGYQGPKGISIQEDWLEIVEKTENNITYPTILFPKPPTTEGYIEYTPIVLKTGYINPNFQSAEDYRGSVKTIYTDSLNGGLQEKIALRIQNSNKFADFKLKLRNNNLDFEIGRILSSDLGFNLQNISNETVYQINSLSYLNSSNDLITVGNNLNTTIKTFDFISHNQIKIDKGSFSNYVLISDDINGKVKWVDKKSIFGSFPIGSIISIRPEDFNSLNFELDTTITQPGPPYTELRAIYGRGKNNTDFDGWYLCNGETWKFQNGVNEFQTPNLCSFNYEIQSNGDGQNLVVSGDNSPIILGGSNISVNANTTGGGNYEVNMTVNTEDDTINVENANYNTEISRMVHIVYLENSELHWSNTEFAPPPPVSTDITLTSSSVTSAIACTKVPNTLFSWNGANESEWDTFDHTLTQRYLYVNNTTIFAGAGWYKNSNGTTRYWNGTSFTQISICSTASIFTAELVTDPNTLNLNGAPGEYIGTTYEITGSNLFSTCNGIYDLSTGENAIPGWYRDTEDGTRRYWDGNQFVGNLFTKNYIHPISPMTSYSIEPYTIGCNISTALGRSTYIETDLQSIEGANTINDLVHTNTILYVHQNWTVVQLGTAPLVNVISQNAPNTTSKYRVAYHIVIIEEPGEDTMIKTFAEIDQAIGTLVYGGTC